MFRRAERLIIDVRPFGSRRAAAGGGLEIPVSTPSGSRHRRLWPCRDLRRSARAIQACTRRPRAARWHAESAACGVRSQVGADSRSHGAAPYPSAGLDQVAHRLAAPERPRQVELDLVAPDRRVGAATSAACSGIESSRVAASRRPRFLAATATAAPAIRRPLSQVDEPRTEHPQGSCKLASWAFARRVHHHRTLAQHLQRRIGDSSTVTFQHRRPAGARTVQHDHSIQHRGQQWAEGIRIKFPRFN